MINKAILVGNLGADPESRTTQSGVAVCNLRIATSERQKDKDGNWGDHTEWHRVCCFGKTAENVAKFKRKGDQVYIEGKIRTSKWQDKDGNDRWSTEVVAFDVKFIGGKGGGDQQQSSGGSSSGGYGGGSPASSGARQASGGQDDGIPF